MIKKIVVNVKMVIFYKVSNVFKVTLIIVKFIKIKTFVNNVKLVMVRNLIKLK